jgi:thiamine pyrophosphate-dependent acetolactate synthase large subunit-like protein
MRSSRALFPTGIRRWTSPATRLAQGESRSIAQAARLLANAQRPLIMAGNGVILSGAHESLRTLAGGSGLRGDDAARAGRLPDDHPLALGCRDARLVHVNRALQSDVPLNVGGRFDDRVTGRASTLRRVPIIHVDIDVSEIGKLIPTTAGMSATPAGCWTAVHWPAAARRVARTRPRDAGDAPAATGVHAPSRNERVDAADVSTGSTPLCTRAAPIAW